MIESYYIGVYWGVRRESVEMCTQRAVQFLTNLTRCSPYLSHWFMPGQSIKEALKHEIGIDAETISQLLVAGKNYADFGSKAIEPLGFRLSLWSPGGNSAESSSLTIKCGSYAPIPGINSCVINLPYQGASADNLLHTPMLTTIMEYMVEAWNPDWGVVNSNMYQKMIPFPPSNAPRIGWIIYLSRRRGAIPPLPPPSKTIALGMQGSLVITTEERFTANNPLHIKAAHQVATILDQAGLLGPLA